MPEQNIVADIRVGSLISVTGELGGAFRKNAMCELKAVDFGTDGVRFVVWSLEEKRLHLVDPREVAVELVCRPFEQPDDESELDMQVDGPLKARRSALRVCAWTFGVVATLLVSVALLGVGGLFLGGFVVGEAALYCHEKKRWERLS